MKTLATFPRAFNDFLNARNIGVNPVDINTDTSPMIIAYTEVPNEMPEPMTLIDVPCVTVPLSPARRIFYAKGAARGGLYKTFHDLHRRVERHAEEASLIEREGRRVSSAIEGDFLESVLDAAKRGVLKKGDDAISDQHLRNGILMRMVHRDGMGMFIKTAADFAEDSDAKAMLYEFALSFVSPAKCREWLLRLHAIAAWTKAITKKRNDPYQPVRLFSGISLCMCEPRMFNVAIGFFDEAARYYGDPHDHLRAAWAAVHVTKQERLLDAWVWAGLHMYKAIDLWRVDPSHAEDVREIKRFVVSLEHIIKHEILQTMEHTRGVLTTAHDSWPREHASYMKRLIDQLAEEEYGIES